MDSEPKSENVEKPPLERPAEERAVNDRPSAERPTVSRSNDNRGRPDRGRGRGRGRFNRDNRGERGDRGTHAEQARPRDPLERQPHTGGGMGRVIEQVNQIRVELKRVLEDMDEVLNALDQIEREKNASEDEIEQLRESLRSLYRGPSQPRYPKVNPPLKPSVPAETDSQDSEPDTEASADLD